MQDLTAIARGIDLLEQLHEEISANALREDNRIGARLARAVTYQAPMPAIPPRNSASHQEIGVASSNSFEHSRQHRRVKLPVCRRIGYNHAL